MAMRNRIHRLFRSIPDPKPARPAGPCHGCANATWKALGPAGEAILAGIAERLEVPWPPSPCPQCGQSGDDNAAYLRLLGGATDDESEQLRALVR